MALSDPDQQHDDIRQPPNVLIQPPCERRQGCVCVPCRHGEQYADEEHERAHVDFRQRMRERQMVLVLIPPCI